MPHHVVRRCKCDAPEKSAGAAPSGRRLAQRLRRKVAKNDAAYLGLRLKNVGWTLNEGRAQGGSGLIRHE